MSVCAQVRYEDLERALREVEPSGSEKRRGVLARTGRRAVGAWGGQDRRGLRAWLREARLRRLTERAMRQGKDE